MPVEPRLWLYWEGPMPAYIRLCADLLLAYNPNAVLLGPDDLPQLGFSQDVLAAIGKWHVCQRSDAIRTILLANHGGMWCDVDCIPLRPFHYFARLAETSPSGIAAYDSTDNTIGVGFLAARAGGEVISRLQQHVMEVIRSGRTPGWLEVSSEPMTRIVGDIGRENCPIIPLEHVAPISWRDQYVMYGRDIDANHRGWVDPRPSAYCFMLSNQALGDEVRRMTRHELLTSDRLISFLFRESIARLQALQVTECSFGKGGHYSEPIRRRHAGAMSVIPNVPPPSDGARNTWKSPGHCSVGMTHSWKSSISIAMRPPTTVSSIWTEMLLFAPTARAFSTLYPRLTSGPWHPSKKATISSFTFSRRWIRFATSSACRWPMPRNTSIPVSWSSALKFTNRPLTPPAAFTASHLNDPGKCTTKAVSASASNGPARPCDLLPPEFNRCGERLWDHWTPKMDSYIWHFCGKKTWDAMQNTTWKEID